MPIDFEKLSSLIAEQKSREYSFAHVQKTDVADEQGESVDWPVLLNEHVQVSFEYLQALFQLFRDKKIDETRLVGFLKLFLNLRDAITQRGDLDCTYIHGAPISVVCSAIAEAITKPGRAVAQELMPTVTEAIGDTLEQGLVEYTEEVTTEADGTQQRHFHLREYFRTTRSQIVNLIDVWNYGIVKPELVLDGEKGENQLGLTYRDKRLLRGCLGEASEKHYVNLTRQHVKEHERDFFGYHLKLFIASLYESSKKGQGTEKKADLTIAGPAIIQFHKIWTALNEADRNKIAGLTLKGFEEILPATFERFLLALFAEISEIELTQEQMDKLEKQNVLNCTHDISWYFSEFLNQYPWLYDIKMTSVNTEETLEERKKKSQETLNELMQALEKSDRKVVGSYAKDNRFYLLLSDFYKKFLQLIVDENFLTQTDNEKAVSLSHIITTWDELLFVVYLKNWRHILPRIVFEQAVADSLKRNQPTSWDMLISGLNRPIYSQRSWVSIVSSLSIDIDKVRPDEKLLETEIVKMLDVIPAESHQTYLQFLDHLNIRFSHLDKLISFLFLLKPNCRENYLRSYDIAKLKVGKESIADLGKLILAMLPELDGAMFGAWFMRATIVMPLLAVTARFSDMPILPATFLERIQGKVQLVYSWVGMKFMQMLAESIPSMFSRYPRIISSPEFSQFSRAFLMGFLVPGESRLNFLRNYPGYPDSVVTNIENFREILSVIWGNDENYHDTRAITAFLRDYDRKFYEQNIRDFDEFEKTLLALYDHGVDIKIFFIRLGGLDFLKDLSGQPNMQVYNKLGLGELSDDIVSALIQPKLDRLQRREILSIEEVTSILKHMQQPHQLPDGIISKLQPSLRKHLQALIQQDDTYIILINLCCEGKLSPDFVDIKDMPLLHLLLDSLNKSQCNLAELDFNSRYYHLKRFLCFTKVDLRKKYRGKMAYAIANERYKDLLDPAADSCQSSIGIQRLCIYGLFDLALAMVRAEHEMNKKIELYKYFSQFFARVAQYTTTEGARSAPVLLVLDRAGNLAGAKLQLPKKPNTSITAVELLLLCDNYLAIRIFLQNTVGAERIKICELTRNYFNQRKEDNETFGNLQESAQFESEAQDILQEIEKILAEEQAVEVIAEEPVPDENNEADTESIAVDVIGGGEGTANQTEQAAVLDVASSSAQVDSSRTTAVSAMVQRGTAISSGNTVHEEITESRESIREGKREVDIGEKLIGVSPSKSQ